MVHIVISFPPAKAEAAHEVGNNDTNSGINGKVVSDTHVTGVVGTEHQLMPEKTEEDGTKEIPPFPQKEDE